MDKDYTFEITLSDYDIFDAVSIEDIVEYFNDREGTKMILEAIGKQDALDWLGVEAMVDWLEKNAPSVLRDDKREELPVLTPEE